MAEMSYKTRRRLSLLVLLVWLPLYIVLAVTLADWLRARFDRFPIWAEVLVFVALGFLWALPFKRVFRGVGQAEPGAPEAKKRP